MGELFMAEERMTMVANHIVQNHKAKTRNKQYTAIFAVSSIPALVKYYEIFKAIDHDLTISGIFSFGANEDYEEHDEHSRDSLERIIGDYNQTFSTNFSTDTFHAYHKDISDRVKGKKTKALDILLVVNMFLTGFDSKPLSVLYGYHWKLSFYKNDICIDTVEGRSKEDPWRYSEFKSVVEFAERFIPFDLGSQYMN